MDNKYTKIIIFVIILFLLQTLLLFIWHTNTIKHVTQQIKQDTNTIQNSTEETPITSPKIPPPKTLHIDTDDAYKQWTIPLSLLETLKEGDTQKINSKTDCIGLANGYTGGGDLLSSLIIDDKARKLMKLNIYTKEYIKQLEQKVVKQTHEEYNADFYSFYVCHIENDIDILLGTLIPQGESAFIESGKFEGDIKSGEYLFVISYPEYIYTNNTVQPLHQTATGGEVYPCDASFENKEIAWKCFEGFDRTYSTSSTIKSKIKTWYFPIHGGEPTIIDSVE